MAPRDEGPHQKVYEWIGGVRVYKRTSPSQQKDHKLCPRKWWYGKIADLPRKTEGKGVKLGKQCHGRVEHFLETGEDVRGPLELSGAHMLDPFLQWAPSQFLIRNDTTQPDNTIRVSSEAIARAKELAPLKVEESIGDLRTPGGVAIVGFADLMLPPGLISFPLLGQPPMANQAQVLDHKFKKNLAKYADTEKDLLDDPQAVNYGKAVMIRWPTTEWVRFAHHNHQTEGRRDAFARAVILSRKEIETKFSVLTDYVDGPMSEDCARHSDIHVKANSTTGACEAFGGCDFALTCPSSPRNRFLVQIPGVTRPGVTLEVKKEDLTVGLLDQMQEALKAQQGGAPASTAAGVPATTPAPATQPAATPPASDTIPAGMAIKDQIYFAQNQLGATIPGKAMGAMGDSAVFVNSSGAMFQCNVMTPIRSAMNDPGTLATFGLGAAPASTPAPAGPPPRKMDGMPIVETINGVPTQVSGTPIPGLAQANLPAGFQVQAPAVQGAGVAVNPPNGQTAAPNPEAAALMAAALQAQQAAALGQAAPASTPAAQPTTVTNVVNTAAPATTPATNTTPPAGDAPATTTTRKRGRPPGSGRKAAEDVATGAAQAAQLGGLILIVDAAVSGEARDLADYVADLHEAVCKAVTPAVADVRLADPKGPLGYGAWRGAMAAAAAASPPTGVCTISRGDLADPVIEALSAQATLVIRGRA